MPLSFSAMNRLTERRAAEDDAYRRQLVRNGKHVLADGRALSDEALVDKLHALGFSDASRSWLDELSRQYPSAELLATRAIENADAEIPDLEHDWVWIAVSCLWERWFPDRPNFEMVDDWMQEGYRLEREDRPVEAARLGLRAWRAVLRLMDVFDIPTLDAFDEEFNGTNSAFNWVQDLSNTLYRAGVKYESFHRERIAFCTAAAELAFRSERDEALIETFRQDLAESLIAVGDFESADRHLAQWLQEDPQWGRGWIAWAHSFFESVPAHRCDLVRAERLLTDALALTDICDRGDVCEALEYLHDHVDASMRAPDDPLDPGGSQLANESSLDDVVAGLARPYTGILPKAALREAQRRREEITPRLIELIRDATLAVRAGEEPDGDGHFFALFLLAEFEARQALPAVLEALSLPDDGPDELFGGAVTESLKAILAVLAVDRPEAIDELIAGRAHYQWVRWAAAETWLYWVRDGRMTRDEAVERLRRHLRDAIANEDHELATGLVHVLSDYAPREAQGEIEQAFEAHLVDTMFIGLEDLLDDIERGERHFQEKLAQCPPGGIQDTVEELSTWAAFRGTVDRERIDGEPERPDLYDDEFSDEFDDEALDDALGLQDVSGWQEPIRRTTPRVGRNDPCPCGSGKKFKKCCLHK